MIRLETIHIREFRGIKDLKLDLKGKNFAACGPNGTGKSGIVDAIEFALTGGISRLSGDGTGSLSVKAHGPHVDSRNKPEDAFVELGIIIPSLEGKKATIRRNVKTAGRSKITPADVDVVAILEFVNLHPELVLSRRELIRYVVSEPGKRSKEVQALLRLDDIERLRIVLQKISNACSRDLPGLERSESDAIKNLLTALNAPQLTKKTVLDAVNACRETLGLPPLNGLDGNISVKGGCQPPRPQRCPRSSRSCKPLLILPLRGKPSRLFARTCLSIFARQLMPWLLSLRKIPTASTA